MYIKNFQDLPLKELQDHAAYLRFRNFELVYPFYYPFYIVHFDSLSVRIASGQIQDTTQRLVRFLRSWDLLQKFVVIYPATSLQRLNIPGSSRAHRTCGTKYVFLSW